MVKLGSRWIPSEEHARSRASGLGSNDSRERREDLAGERLVGEPGDKGESGVSLLKPFCLPSWAVGEEAGKVFFFRLRVGDSSARCNVFLYAEKPLMVSQPSRQPRDRVESSCCESTPLTTSSRTLLTSREEAVGGRRRGVQLFLLTEMRRIRLGGVE